MANIRNTTNAAEKKKAHQLRRVDHRDCERAIERRGLQDVWDPSIEAYTHDPRPEVGDVFECRHGWIIEVVNVFYRSQVVITRYPGERRYSRGKRAIKREARKAVLAERQPAGESSDAAMSTALFGFPGLHFGRRK